MNKTQAATYQLKMNRHTLLIQERDHTPHWLRPGQDHGTGKATVDIDVPLSKDHHHLSLDVREWYTTDKGVTSEKRTMVTLDENSMRQLLEILRLNLLP